MAVLGSLMSTHILTACGLFCLGTTTMGDTQGVGPVTGSMMSSPSSRFNSSSIPFRILNGILLCGRATGLTSSFIWSLTWMFFSLPNPVKRFGNSLTGFTVDFFSTLLSTWMRPKSVAVW
uniref:Putative secreted protein n=1 Tax=Ixodes ricinus TaxID=34613 RepID=A0A6B0UNE6_IXORI